MVQRIRLFRARRTRVLRDSLRRAVFAVSDAFRRYPVVSILCSVLLFIVPFSLLLGAFEPDNDSTLWKTLIYVFSGLDVDPPQSAVGKAAAVLILISGVIFVSLMTGYVAASFTHLLLHARAVPTKPEGRLFEGHVIMVGWGAKSKAVLRELNADRAARGVVGEDIIVVSEDASIERGPEPIYKSVFHVRGKATDPDTLRRADLTPHRGKGAKVVALLRDPALHPDEADRRTLLSVLAVEHLFPEVISLAEVAQPSEEQHFRNANVDEVVFAGEFTNSLLARAAAYPGVADYFDELLALSSLERPGAAGRSPCSFYVESAARLGLVGLQLADAVSEAYSRHRVLVAGIVHGEKFRLLVDASTSLGRAVEQHDVFLVIAVPEALEKL